MKQIIDRSEFSSDHPEHMRVTGRPIDDAVTEDAIRALMERHKVEELRVAALRKAAPEAHGEDLEKIVTEEPAATEKPAGQAAGSACAMSRNGATSCWCWRWP